LGHYPDLVISKSNSDDLAFLQVKSHFPRMGRKRMGLFFEMLSAINNPSQRGSVEQLGAVMNTIQQLGARQGINPSTMQMTMSALGSFIRPILQRQSQAGGGQQLNQLVNQFAGSNPSTGATSALQSWLTPQLQQQLIQGVAQTTGLANSTLQTLLPELVSAAMALLSMGASKPGVPGSNSVLNTFINSDRDRDTDLGDVLKFASRFLDSVR
jgi:hypothetical protein